MKTKEMTFKMKREIIAEAEKLHGFDNIINVIAKVTPFGVLHSVSFMDGYGMPTERLTAWHSNPQNLLDAVREQSRLKEMRNK